MEGKEGKEGKERRELSTVRYDSLCCSGLEISTLGLGISIASTLPGSVTSKVLRSILQFSYKMIFRRCVINITMGNGINSLTDENGNGKGRA